ncbi:hypothetical protein [Streptomyces sp. NPDC001914]|uniref:hypothetical protein n=1 Tax=Streptomyces sp. NPDC001914 TaxID=3364623 RepID=UPI0036AC819A
MRLNEPAIIIRKIKDPTAPEKWTWRCVNSNCGWAGHGLGSQQAALRAACHHLAASFDRHHGMVESSPSWNEDAGRARATCYCGFEAEEKTEAGAEYTIEAHAEWLRETLPARVTEATADA